jgi:hypothetical protein
LTFVVDPKLALIGSRSKQSAEGVQAIVDVHGGVTFMFRIKSKTTSKWR